MAQAALQVRSTRLTSGMSRISLRKHSHSLSTSRGERAARERCGEQPHPSTAMRIIPVMFSSHHSKLRGQPAHVTRMSMSNAQAHASRRAARASEGTAEQQVQKVQRRREVQALLGTLYDQRKVPSPAHAAVSACPAEQRAEARTPAQR
jgi:hypothetical protein